MNEVLDLDGALKFLDVWLSTDSQITDGRGTEGAHLKPQSRAEIPDRQSPSCRVNQISPRSAKGNLSTFTSLLLIIF